MLKSDPAATFRRVEELTTYMGREVLSPACHGVGTGTFVCPSEKDCRASAGTADFHEGQLSQVGEHYDLFDDGHPLRIVVVGQEYGSDARLVSLAARRSMLLTGSGRERRYYADAAEGYKARNPHMRGTTSALRLLFGRDVGHDRAGEFLDLVSGERTHMFDAFALVNALLCGAHGSGTTQGRSTAVMRDNCSRHFRETLRILAPTVVVLQGKGVEEWTRDVFADKVRPLDDNADLVRLDGRDVFVCRFSHPSARGERRWGDKLEAPYLREVVAPTLRAVRAAILSA